MNPSPPDPPRYAGFRPRLGAFLLDLLILLPAILLLNWGKAHYRLFELYEVGPETLLNLFYSIYLVQRFGGTPGKLMVGIRIRKVQGGTVGYREAVLRCLPLMVLDLLIYATSIYARFHISDAEFQAFSPSELRRREIALAPSWYWRVVIETCLWILADATVFFANPERRALHDFIAGTVVVHKPRARSPRPQAAALA